MCVAAPGRVIRLYQENGVSMGEVDFGGLRKAVCLAHVEEVKEDAYVMVHAGFALEIVDPAEVALFYSHWQDVLGTGAGRGLRRDADSGKEEA
jgi:hydrogenase expression/formation protein HypC